MTDNVTNTIDPEQLMTNVTPVDCPICQSHAWLKRLMPATRNMKGASGKHRTFQDPEVCISLCRKCGLVVEDGIYSDEYYQQFFAGYYMDNPQNYEWSDKWKADQRLSILAPLLTGKPETILEIASATGANLDFFRQTYGSRLCVGVEPIVEYVEYSNDKFPEITVSNSRWEDYSSGNSFDLIIAGFCVGHFNHPLSAFSKIRDALDDKGIFYLDDGGNPLHFFKNKKASLTRTLLTSEKRFYYTPETLTRMLTKVGFDIVVNGEYDDPTRGASDSALYFVCRKAGPIPEVKFQDWVHGQKVLQEFRLAKMRILRQNIKKPRFWLSPFWHMIPGPLREWALRQITRR